MTKAATWFGGLLLAWCGVPLLIQTISDGHANGISPSFLLIWLAGEVLMLFGTWRLKENALRVNFMLNIVIISSILLYRLHII